MMKLYYSPTSPYVRKVSVVALETGLAVNIERIPTNVQAPDAAFVAANPLSKVPALITDDGLVLFDSPVICEYLDSLHGGRRLFPDQEPERWLALRRQALADGIADATALCRMELLRPEAKRWSGWVDRQWGKVTRGLDVLAGEAATLADGPSTIGEIAVGCALGFLDFRFADRDWRPGRPSLAAWYEAFAAHPSMQATAPHEP
ncbi:MAG: glutathione S-transferase N-terminal domain-containing protein [Rhodospirillales bacterium]